jgi:glycerol uptake facilitator-like aquaporin
MRLLLQASIQESQFITLNAGATTLSSSNEWYQGLIIETVLTLILTQTILNSAVDTSSNVLAPLAIGMTVMLDIFSA